MAKYDVVLYGATGFTGKLVANYLASHPSRSDFSWAIAGRNPDKLAELEASLSPGGDGPDVIIAEASDAASVSSMVSDARVVLTTAGPYSEYHGDTVVECCARTGTDYADLSGEYWFQRRMIDEFHGEAQRTGAKIVVAAGVDSIPSDLGAQFAIEHLESVGAKVAHIKALFTDYAGSFSGGTNKTLAALASLMKSDNKGDASFHEDPYVLAPEATIRREGETVKGWDQLRFDRDFKAIGGPFFMAPINARIVRRSLALNGHLPCSYEEGISAGAWLKAGWLWMSRGFGYFVGAPIPFRPKPGEGPPPWLQRAGKFRVLIHATSETGAESVTVEVNGRGDPGYLATSKMLAEVGLSLALDRENLPPPGGVLTPATALGAPLRRRLSAAEDGSFMQFRVIDR
jgi:short subunit dehydrogenase-like uncharacterized protein